MRYLYNQNKVKLFWIVSFILLSYCTFRSHPIVPHLRKIVYFTAIKYGGDTEWEFLWRKYKDCKNAAEKEKTISALCATRNKDVLQR